MSAVPRERWCKHWRLRALHMWINLRRPMLKARREDGTPLYTMTSNGNWKRTQPLSARRRSEVIERDGACTLCGDGPPFEVDHIIRYVDGGSNEMENLRTLCHPCHRRRGGRA